MKSIYIEAESFDRLGGWIVDTASMEQLGSSYIMAHGMGVPVEDAVTAFEIEECGTYHIWALTRDWTAVWNVEDPAGKYCMIVDGKTLDTILGTNGRDWAWQLAGTMDLQAGKHILALHDLTGFNGRCDAVFITRDFGIPNTEMLRNKVIKDWEKAYDLVVVGGGVAGICTALAALRSGVSVALIHDRGILGGCNSSEVRVCQGGQIHIPPYPALGNVVKEIAPVVGYPSIYEKAYFEDDRKRFAFELREGQKADHQLLLNYAVTDVEHEGKNVTAVICTNTLTGDKLRIKGTLFSDCSGDGIVARKMGCQTMYGREAADVFGETLAPKEHQNVVMGQSIRWYSEETDKYVEFPKIDWNLKFDDASCLNSTLGDWEQETGFTRDMVAEAEYIRDFGLRAIYSNWSYQKHSFSQKGKFANRKLKWVSAIGGKREGYRVVGDYILSQRDLEEKPHHEDETAAITWSIDMHFPEPGNLEQFGEAFRSFAYHRGIVTPYPVPYRCLYARDVENLFIGGRLISASHVAFSAVRVMRTLGELGEVAGLASSVCKKYGCTPRQVYTEHLADLIELMKKGVESPDTFAWECADEETYHFKDSGWWWLNLAKAQHPEEFEAFRKGVAFLGLEHKYPMPEKWDQAEE